MIAVHTYCNKSTVTCWEERHVLAVELDTLLMDNWLQVSGEKPCMLLVVVVA